MYMPYVGHWDIMFCWNGGTPYEATWCLYTICGKLRQYILLKRWYPLRGYTVSICHMWDTETVCSTETVVPHAKLHGVYIPCVRHYVLLKRRYPLRGHTLSICNTWDTWDIMFCWNVGTPCEATRCLYTICEKVRQYVLLKRWHILPAYLLYASIRRQPKNWHICARCCEEQAICREEQHRSPQRLSVTPHECSYFLFTELRRHRRCKNCGKSEGLALNPFLVLYK
jgi:hypothetical protein